MLNKLGWYSHNYIYFKSDFYLIYLNKANIMNICLNCKEEISLKAKYCSDKCRKAYSRRKSDIQPGQTPDNQVGHIKSDKPEQEEKNELYLKKLSELLLEEGKTQEEVEGIIGYQKDHYERYDNWFIPNRFSKSLNEIIYEQHTAKKL